MIKFEKVSKFENIDIPMPTRATEASSGYDLYVAEDIVVPPFEFLIDKIRSATFKNNDKRDYWGFIAPYSLADVSDIVKKEKAKIPLISTGVKCALEPDTYLQLSMRSSTPLKHWLILGNGIGVIDADYYNNPDNEGEIFLQIINLLPFAIQLKRGDKIAQGIVCKYLMATDDSINNTQRLGGFGSTDT